MTSVSSTSFNSRPAAVAGLFYPDAVGDLHLLLNAYLHRSAQSNDINTRQINKVAGLPKALIVPHAGYVYSGAAAGAGFAAILPCAPHIRRVVLFGPAHRVAFKGIAVADCNAFETPLGQVPVDLASVQQLQDFPQVIASNRAHAQEHSLEVQLPFLQSMLTDFSIVPLVVGDASPEAVKAVMALLWGGEETLVVVSSDLSHYHDYDTAQQLDRRTCEAIERLDDRPIGYEQACGCVALRALLLMARTKGMRANTVALCNSGDTAGDKSRVVGYGSWVFAYESA